MATLTITFRAKLDEFSGGQGYKVPALKSSHVTYSRDIGPIEADLRNGRMNAVAWWLARKLDGYRLPTVVWAEGSGMLDESIEESARWTIKPIGNGFMAEVSRTFDSARVAA